jgi:hypothetical protein
MGVVYEAEQVSLRRRVALKVLPNAGMLDQRQLQRFKNEAQAAACLHHTNIVPVYFVGSERGVHFYAMQFIDGQTLAALIRQLRSPLDQAPEQPTVAYQPPDRPASAADTESLTWQLTQSGAGPKRGREYYRRVAELGVQAAEALDHAHQMGIVHRDVKPGNLLLDNTGRLWVTDFGLAHIQHGEASLTLTGDLVGTLRYMSPEQALAKRVPIDHRTDVYSLGATLYELLTLRPACAGKDRQELLRQIAFEEPVNPRRLTEGVPQELETIVLKAMEKNPADRYGTAQELADDLRRYLADQPIRARRPSLAQHLAKWARRHRPLVTLALVMVLLVGIVALIGYATTMVALGREAEARQRAEEARGREVVEHQLAESQRDAAQDRLYVSNMRLAQAAWETGDVERARELLEQHRPAEGQRDLRGWEWYYLQGLCHGTLPTFTEPVGQVNSVAWSPDERYLAIQENFSGTVTVWDVTIGQTRCTLRRATPRQLGGTMAWWSPDARFIATLKGGRGNGHGLGCDNGAGASNLTRADPVEQRVGPRGLEPRRQAACFEHRHPTRSGPSHTGVGRGGAQAPGDPPRDHGGYAGLCLEP